MKKQNQKHHLVEYIVDLLNILETENVDISNIDATSLMELADEPGNCSGHESQNIQIAYEAVKFMDEMPGGFLIYHAEGNEQIIYANKALLRIFQCSTLQEFREITNNSFQGLVYPEDLDEVEQSIWEQISASQYDLDYVEYRIIRKDGSLRWIEDYGHYIYSESSGGIFYVFIGDATEKRKKQLEEKATILNERLQNEKKLQRLIEEYDKEIKLINQEHLRRLEVIEGLSINYDSILYADLDTDKILPYRLSSRNSQQFDNEQQARSYLWYTSEYIKEWVHPDDSHMVSVITSPGCIREKLLNHKTFYINYRIVDNGEVQYLQLRIVNVGSKNHISQIVMGYRRVDEELRSEMEQKQILEEALNNADLAITAKNTFLSNMSHDMRTPLNAIFGYTVLARKYTSNREAVEDYLEKIESSGRQLLDLIDKVLEISWTETNDVKLEEAECNLCDIMQDLHNTLLPQAEKKHITLLVNSSRIMHYDVFSDPVKLKQLFMHLSNNAIKYTKDGGMVDISLIELERLPNDHIVCQFTVEDTGIGIGEEFLEHIFEPFEREKNTTLSGVHGTGLGLTIVKNITEMMGGKIDVKSTAGKGSKFTVTLRLRIQEQPLSISNDNENTLSQLMNHKILLVEDNEINLEIETEILQGLGFVIETAVNGSIAVEKIKEAAPGEFALVLMDIQMPVMDGLQATQLIRKIDNPELATIPIIALSANAFESDRRMSIESGMNAHLNKPIDVPLLLETLIKTLKK
ncbi:MAG: response regulator [Lachnospiraceae bacterium]|nr:response regulator [Lachnospiraceae bacterium]